MQNSSQIFEVILFVKLQTDTWTITTQENNDRCKNKISLFQLLPKWRAGKKCMKDNDVRNLSFTKQDRPPPPPPWE